MRQFVLKCDGTERMRTEPGGRFTFNFAMITTLQFERRFIINSLQFRIYQRFC